MGLTDKQELAVKTKGRPLFIQAGAGTGKTFTLTKRLGFGLSAESGPLIGGVDRLLTITFTNKAAGELMGRVRGELRERAAAGEKELEQAALQVDAAWISTIHSMCKNMLQEHTFEAGVDAGARMLSEEESARLLESALDEVFVVHADDERLRALIGAFGADAAHQLISRLATDQLQLSPQGSASFDFGPEPHAADARLLHMAREAASRAIDELQELGAPDTATCVKSFEKLTESLEKLTGFLTDGASGQITWEDVVAVLESCPLTRGGNVKKQYKPAFASAYEALVSAQASAASALAYERLHAAVELAELVLARHRELKGEIGAVDIGDLLIEAFRLLDGHPDVADEYRERFSSVMVDEFQDTDRLQVEIIERICDDGLTTLATVGDAQQSIYGFRGADLEVYRGMRAQMAELGSQEVSLDTNYRSHPDILGFVEDIFSTQEFFGREFLKVGSGRNLEQSPCPWEDDGQARVAVLLSAGCKPAGGGRGHTSADALRKSCAETIALEFERYARAGAKYGEMAILMRATTHAHVYLDALREHGIPCMMSGGSAFYTLDEVLALTMFLRVLENRDDDEALYSVLGSRFFDVTDDDLLSLAVVNKQYLRLAADEARVKQSLFDALEALCGFSEAKCKRLGVTPPSPLLVRAHAVLANALSSVGSRTLSGIVGHAVEESGWYSTLQTQGPTGMAVQANIDKFCDLLDEYAASEGADVLGAAEHFREMCELAEAGAGARGKPGVMVSHENDAVQVMTIHASKGLEFPIVAVAEFESSGRFSATSVEALTENGVTHLALTVSTTKEAKGYIEDLSAEVESFEKATSTLSHAAYARALAKRRAKEEEQRLLYVALTRARDALLLVAHDPEFASKGQLKASLFADCIAAVCPDGLPGSGATVLMPCGERVRFAVTTVPYESGEAPEGAHEGEAQLRAAVVLGRERRTPPLPEPLEVTHRAFVQRGFQSYSSIAKHESSDGDVAVSLRNRAEDVETVSVVGSAFHLVSEWAVRQAEAAPGALEERIAAAARRYDLDRTEVERLESALSTWLSSERFKALKDYPVRRAEYPFYVSVAEEPLEGYIDLLCMDPQTSEALIVDYKTGTSGQADELRERYSLQAACYSYAVMELGLAERVQVVFVRPEVEMQEIVYDFDAGDVEDLEAKILGQ